MRQYRIGSVEVRRFPVLHLTFDDGLAGEIDLTSYLERGPFFAPLADRDFFSTVRVAPNGRSFGWRLDQPGQEIDFGADAARAEVETALVEQRADRFRRRPAAE
jgi:hypothetical protein